MRSKGKITSWNDDKGYGFIAPNDGGSPIFVHATAFANLKQRPAVKHTVTYLIKTDRRGRARAENATLAGESLQLQKKKRIRNAPVIPTVLILISVTIVSVFLTNLPLLIPLVYSVMSFITFMTYAIDKSAAKNDRWRTSEATLHFLALAGGWPGALLAQHILRHKSKKEPFRTVLWMTVLLNCVALGWLHTSDGRVRLEKLLTLILNS